MRSKPSSPSRSRSRTELAYAIALAVATACGGGGGGGSADAAPCGTGGAPDDGIAALGSDADGSNIGVTFTDLRGGADNDCTASGAPDGVIGYTIEGSQEGSAGAFAICISRPDLLATTPQQLGADVPGSPVHVITVSGSVGSACTVTLADSPAPSGTISAAGLCDDGSDASGFALTIAGSAALTLTCGSGSSATTETFTAALTGTAAVLPR